MKHLLPLLILCNIQMLTIAMVHVKLQQDSQNKTVDASLQNALWDAVIRNKIEIVQELLTAPLIPDINQQSSISGITVLMSATFNEHPELVQLLIDAGAQPNLQDDWGTTALMYAAEQGLKSIVQLLLKAEANPHIRDSFGRTALMRATKVGYIYPAEHIETLQMLIDAEADLTHQNNSSPLLLTTFLEEHADIAKLLVTSHPSPHLVNENEQLERALDRIFPWRTGNTKKVSRKKPQRLPRMVALRVVQKKEPTSCCTIM